jgi:hypothetical protein
MTAMTIAMKHFQKSSQQGSGDGIRVEGRPHLVIIISASLGARPSMSSRDGVMAHSCDAFAMFFAIIAVFAVKLRCVLCVSRNAADVYRGRCGRLGASLIRLRGQLVVDRAIFLKRKERNDRYGHRNETLPKVIATGVG